MRLDDLLRRVDERERILSRAECEALAARARSASSKGGTTDVSVDSWWAGALRWGRNRVRLASDRRDVSVSVLRKIHERAVGRASTNQIDDASLVNLVRAAERNARLFGVRELPKEIELHAPWFEFPRTRIWSDATYDLTAEERGAAASALLEPARAAGMQSAGYLEVLAREWAGFPEGGQPRYARQTLAQCSMTVRDPQGTGSGWAGLTSFDWSAIDAEALARRALEKCLASRNPVALEPGRYTVVLEPQAVYDLVSCITWGREEAERGTGPWVAGADGPLGLVRSKLGLPVVDSRITISHDPADPELGVMPFTHLDGEPYRPVTWIDHGVLTTLSDQRDYALRSRNDNLGTPDSRAFRMSGGETSVDEMIRSTRRGLLVTRFSNVVVLDRTSLICTGLTRDGVWLIENGKISKPVKNFRFTDSPLFVLNSVEQLGPPVPVFGRPGQPAIVPPIKARDFSFTSLADAI